MLLAITLEANVEVTCQMCMKCIWQKHWKNFLPKTEMFPACKHLFPEALAPSVTGLWRSGTVARDLVEVAFNEDSGISEQTGGMGRRDEGEGREGENEVDVALSN